MKFTFWVWRGVVLSRFQFQYSRVDGADCTGFLPASAASAYKATLNASIADAAVAANYMRLRRRRNGVCQSNAVATRCYFWHTERARNEWMQNQEIHNSLRPRTTRNISDLIRTCANRTAAVRGAWLSLSLILDFEWLFGVQRERDALLILVVDVVVVVLSQCPVAVCIFLSSASIIIQMSHVCAFSGNVTLCSITLEFGVIQLQRLRAVSTPFIATNCCCESLRNGMAKHKHTQRPLPVWWSWLIPPWAVVAVITAL